MGKDLGKEKGSILCRQDATEYAGQEDSAESTCCGQDCLCMIEFFISGVRVPRCLLGGLARG